MPIDKDGNITAPAPEGERYVTRVAMEFVYSETGYYHAQQIHENIVAATRDGAEQLHDVVGPEVGQLEIKVGYAKNPAALPEGADDPLP